LLLADIGSAQQRVDPANRYERVIAIVPLIGSGTHADPKRPMFTPARHDLNPASRTGIVGFTHIASDDGKFALVEFTARTRAALQPILNDKSIQTFLKGRDKRQDIEAALKKFKKDFDWNKFVGRMQ
jgi:hypothetical protein